MNTSEQTAELFKAISAAQAEFKTVEKNSVNPHFKSKFAPLDSIAEMIRPILPKHGLSAMQFTDIGESGLIVETVIAHESGQFISGRLSMPTTKQDPQGYGSALAYGRRYALAAALGIVSDEDVDGNGSDKKQQAAEYITDEQVTVLRDLLSMGKAYTESAFCKEAKVQKLEQLPAARYAGAFKHVQSQISKELDGVVE